MDCHEQLTAGYIVGFLDAEASFSIGIKVQSDVSCGIRLDPVFSITQMGREPLEIISKAIGAGRIIKKTGQKHLYLLVIDNMDDLANRLIPFLDKYVDLMTIKRKSYTIFREIVMALYQGLHKDPSKLKELVTKAYSLSSLSPKARRKRSLDEIFEIINLHCRA
jgi:hypothetical protein